MKLTLVTLSGVKVDDDIYEAIIPTLGGEISVFPGHEPLVTVAQEGVITIRREKNADDMDYFAISGGVVEISADRIRILVDEAAHGEDIIEAETQAALERAIELRDQAGDQVELEKAHQLVDRHTVRLKVAELQRRRRRN